MDFLPYLIDAVVVLIFVSVILDARRRGFVKMVLSLIAAIISIVIAAEISEPVAVKINDAYVHDIIVEQIDNNLNVEEISAEDIEIVEENIPSEFRGFAEEANVSIEEILEQAANAEGDIIENIVASAEEKIIIPILTAIAFAALYIILMFIFNVIIGLINTVFKLPVINRLNKMLGGILGVVKGVFVLSVLSIVAVFGARLVPQNEIADAVLNSVLLNKIFEITTDFIL